MFFLLSLTFVNEDNKETVLGQIFFFVVGICYGLLELAVCSGGVVQFVQELFFLVEIFRL